MVAEANTVNDDILKKKKREELVNCIAMTSVCQFVNL